VKRVIAIDGPSGAGKSTIAKAVASKLGFCYLDTGALYRATALGLMGAGLNEGSSDDQIAQALKALDVEFIVGRVHLNGKDVEDKIRDTRVGHFSSVFSARGPVRAFLLPSQKAAAENDDLVVEGRDMTTVVFPGAWVRVFLDASIDSRARRRYQQLKEQGADVDIRSAVRDVKDRDERDSSRDIAPLIKSPDAHHIDSSGMDIDTVVNMVISFTGESV